MRGGGWPGSRPPRASEIVVLDDAELQNLDVSALKALATRLGIPLAETPGPLTKEGLHRQLTRYAL